ncbi:spore maturation protein [bacterium]|nr:spore maturation protein [bacterium]
MINYIWFAFLAAGIITAAFTGRMAEITSGIFDAANVSVELAIGLIGIMSLWLGLMRVAEDAGAVRFIGRLIYPVIRWLFPGIPKEHPALGAVLANLAANMLGLGNSATALGLKAMTELQKLNQDGDSASDDMCAFMAVNTSSVTIIPATIIGIRASAGSNNPTEVIGTIIFATCVSTITAVIASKLFARINRRRRRAE